MSTTLLTICLLFVLTMCLRVASMPWFLWLPLALVGSVVGAWILSQAEAEE